MLRCSDLSQLPLLTTFDNGPLSVKLSSNSLSKIVRRARLSAERVAIGRVVRAIVAQSRTMQQGSYSALHRRKSGRSMLAGSNHDVLPISAMIKPCYRQFETKRN